MVDTPLGMYVGLLSVAFSLGAWSRAGLYCNHQDLSPRCVARKGRSLAPHVVSSLGMDAGPRANQRTAKLIERSGTETKESKKRHGAKGEFVVMISFGSRLSCDRRMRALERLYTFGSDLEHPQHRDMAALYCTIDTSCTSSEHERG